MARDAFWERVKQQIKARDYTQERLANYIGVPVQTLWGWIHYDRIPDAITACHIAEALDVTVEYLVSGEADAGQTHAAELIKKLEAKIEKLTQKIEKS